MKVTSGKLAWKTAVILAITVEIIQVLLTLCNNFFLINTYYPCCNKTNEHWTDILILPFCSSEEINP